MMFECSECDCTMELEQTFRCVECKRLLCSKCVAFHGEVCEDAVIVAGVDVVDM